MWNLQSAARWEMMALPTVPGGKASKQITRTVFLKVPLKSKRSEENKPVSLLN